MMIIFILGIITGWFGAKKYFQPTPPDPDKPSVVTIIEGKPGSIVVSDELFYRDYFTALITATGKAKAEYKVNRPDRWRENKLKHFIGIGPSLSITNNSVLYGGWMSYRYNFCDRFSVLAIGFVSAQASYYDAGVKIGVEMGVR